MKRIVLALALLLVSASAWAQCTGSFGANTVCGTVTGGPPKQTPATSLPAGPITVNSTVISGGTNLQVLYDNLGKVGEYTEAQLTAYINLATASLSGALPAWPNNTTTFFRGDGTYPTLNCAALSGVAASCQTDTTNAANISSGTLPSGRLSGSYTGITGVGALTAGSLATGFTPITTALIGNSQVTYAKVQNETASTLLGNPTGGSAAPSEIALGTGLGFVGGTLTNTGTAALVLLNTLTASNSASLSDTSSFTSTYSSYILIFENLLPATGNADPQLLVHSNGAFPTTSYQFASLGLASTNASESNSGTSSIAFLLDSNTVGVNGSGAGISGELRLYNPSQTSTPKPFIGQVMYQFNSSQYLTLSLTGTWAGGSTAVDGIKFLFSSGNITSGTIRIYGVL